jgi:hypothetical protein
MSSSVLVTANFAASPVPQGAGTYVGLATSTPAAHESSALVRLTANARGSFTGTAIIGGRTYALHNVFGADGTAPELLLSRGAGKPPFRVSLRLDPAAQPPQEIVGQIRSDTFTSDLIAARKVFTAQRNPKLPLLSPPSAWLGPVTAAVDTATFVGHGWATGGISSSGNLRISGSLADGSRWASSTPVTPAGTAPIFALLCGRRGSLVGQATLAAGPPLTFTAPAHWFRPANLDSGPFAAGWADGIGATVRGSAWPRPQPGTPWQPPAFTAGTGAATLSATTVPLTWNATFSAANNRVSIEPSAGLDATLTLQPTTGAYRGAFRPATGSALQRYTGVLLQSDNRALGFFLTPAGSGEVLVVPR